MRGLFPIAGRRKICKQRSGRYQVSRMENNGIWIGQAKKGLVHSKIWEHVHMEIWYTRDIISYWFCRLPVESVQYYAMLDDYHHSGSFCDFSEAFKKTHLLRSRTSRDLLEFCLNEKRFDKNDWYCLIIHDISKNIRTQISVTSNRASVLSGDLCV